MIVIPGVLPSPDVIRQIAEQSGGRCMLAFSGGKDSIAAWLAIREHFHTIIPYYLYLIPGLKFVGDTLAYFEELMGCRIHSLPHPTLWRLLNNYVYQPPERCAIIERANLPNYDYDDTRELLAERLGLDGMLWTADGVRAADSPMRRISLKSHGPINHTSMKFKAVWDWQKREVYEAIERAGIRLPVDYELFNRSFDGIDARFLRPIRDRFPDDYTRILEWFPLAHLQLMRADMEKEHAPC